MSNYKTINDYETLYLISEDMDSSYNILFEKYFPIIKSLAKKYFSFVSNREAEYQDLIQEGYLGLNSAIVSFNQDSNTIFYTYACLCIERQMCTYCKMLAAQKHETLNSAVSEDKYSTNFIVDFSDDANFFDHTDNDIQNLLQCCFNSLDLDTSCVFELRFNGFSYREISQLLDISISNVDSKLSKARRFMKNLLETYD